MVTFLICLAIITVLFGVAFKITGALLKACLWVIIFLPVGLLLLSLGIAFCCTIILIPVGIGIMKAGMRVIIPG